MKDIKIKCNLIMNLSKFIFNKKKIYIYIYILSRIVALSLEVQVIFLLNF